MGRHVGVVGAGTMGAGIAEALTVSGLRTTLVDVSSDAVTAGRKRVDAGLADSVERGKSTASQAERARALLSTAESLQALADCDVVIEAVPEQLDIKLDLFERLEGCCRADAVLATNTSSLLVSRIGAALSKPERALGLHFFNPVPRMRLVEVVPGLQTSQATLEIGIELVQEMAKEPVVANDGIGFLVNRCARPYYGEALKLLQEGIATVDQIDRICRLGGSFRMGPFELIDLIGVDVNLAIAESFYRQSYGEPRWRPNPIQARLVAAGHLGRKSGRGFYDYGRSSDADCAPAPGRRSDEQPRGSVAIHGSGPLALELRERAHRAGYRESVPGAPAWLTIHAEALSPPTPTHRGPRAVLCAATSLRASGADGSVGFHLLPPLENCGLVELTVNEATDVPALDRTEAFFDSLGLRTERVGDAPGLVLGRIVAGLVNEASFAIAEGVGTDHDVDKGMTLGLNHPRGPFAWKQLIGAEHVRAILRGLHRERGEERYRLAPGLACI